MQSIFHPLRMKRRGPDSVDSWLMAIVCILLSMIIYAVVRISGVLFMASVPRFNVDRQSASMPYILTDFVQAISSPLTGYLTQKYGVRLVLGLGGFLSAIGTGACFFAEDIRTVTILWGVVLGMGFGLSVPLFAVVITQNFINKRAIAIGLVYVGGYLGFSTFNGIALHLINYYGLSGTFLYISGMMLHCIPLAMLLRNPNFSKDTPRTIAKKEKASSCGIHLQSISTAVASKEAQFEQYQNVTKDSNISKAKLQTHENYLKGNVNNGFELKSIPEVGIVGISTTRKELELNNLNGFCCKGVRRHLNELENCESNFNKIKIPQQKDEYSKTYESAVVPKDLLSKSSKDCNVVDEYGDRLVYELETNTSHPTDTKLKVKEDDSISSAIQPKSSGPSLAAFKVFLEPVYLVVLITEAVFEGSIIAFLTVIVDFARDVGLPLTYGKYIMLVYSITSCVGLLSFGWVTDNGHMTCTNFAGVLFVLRCITTAIFPFSNGQSLLLVAVSLQGLCESPLSNLFPLIIADYYQKEVHEVAISCRLFLCAPVYLVTPTLIGYFRDDLGSYFYLFILMSSCSLISGGLLFLAPQLAKCRCGRDETILRNKNL